MGCGKINVSGGSNFKINAMVGTYEIEAGNSINAGDLIRFSGDNKVMKSTKNMIGSGAGFYGHDDMVRFERLNDNRLLSYQRDGGRPAIVTLCSIDYTEDPYGERTPIVIGLSSVNTVSKCSSTDAYYLTRLNDSQAIATLINTNNEYGYACLLSVTGDTISNVSSIALASEECDYIRVVAVSDTRAVVLFNKTASVTLNVAILNITGNTLSMSTPLQIDVGNLYNYITIEAIDINKAVVAFRNTGNGYGYSMIINASTGAPVKGNTVNYSASAYYEPSISKLDTNKFIIMYYSGGTVSRYYRIGTVSGNTITYSGEMSSPQLLPHKAKWVKLDDGGFIVPQGNSVLYVTLSGSILNQESSLVVMTYNDEYTFSDLIGFVKWKGNKCLAFYNEDNDDTTRVNHRVRLFDVSLVAEGIALQNGTSGQIKDFYDWR